MPVPKTYADMDRHIRSSWKDSPERRLLLQGLHDLEEGANQMLGHLLSVTAHKLGADGKWEKDEQTKFQVNT